MEVIIPFLARLVAVGALVAGAPQGSPRAGSALRDQLSAFVAEYVTESRKQMDPEAKLSVRARRSFLNAQFATKAFSKATSIDEDFWERTDRRSILVGLIEVHFASCRDLTRARAAVTKADTVAFRLEVLTEFRTIAREHTLIFALSETPQDQQVSRLFQGLTRFRPEKAECMDERPARGGPLTRPAGAGRRPAGGPSRRGSR